MTSIATAKPNPVTAPQMQYSQGQKQKQKTPQKTPKTQADTKPDSEPNVLSFLGKPFQWLSSLWTNKIKSSLKIFANTINDSTNNDRTLEKVLKLRNANMLDGELTEQLRQQGFLGSSSLAPSFKAIDNVDKYREKLKNKTLIHIEQNGELVAYAILANLSELAGKYPELANELKKCSDYSPNQGLFLEEICTDKSFRGKGLAKKLINATRQLGNTKFLLLTIDTENQASIAAHKKMGAKLICPNFHFSGNDYKSDLYLLAL